MHARLIDRAIVRTLPLLPRRAVRSFATPYIAGEQLEDACRSVEGLNRAGKAATIDVLGEEVAEAAEVDELTRAYLPVFDAIRNRRLDANVSVKPTGLGLQLDLDLCRASLRTLVARAEEERSFVRIDMEDASTTDATLRVYRELREQGHDGVGVVLQARLRRTPDDIAALAPLLPSVRLCKGIYLEPSAIAHTDGREIRRAYVRCAEALVESGATIAFATHDGALIAEAERLVREQRLPPERYEFQMLLGVHAPAADALVRAGHRVRVYVPFGARWYEYSLRRLQENPRIATHVATDTLRRVTVTGGRR